MGRKTAMPITPAIPPADAADASDDTWERHVAALADAGIPEPGSGLDASRRRPATGADHEALYGVAPSFADMLPWVEYLPGSKSMLLEDGQSVSAFFELAPVGTEGRDGLVVAGARCAGERAAGLVRRARRKPLGGPALRPG